MPHYLAASEQHYIWSNDGGHAVKYVSERKAETIKSKDKVKIPEGLRPFKRGF